MEPKTDKNLRKPLLWNRKAMKWFRIRFRLTQVDFAEMAGLSDLSVSNFEAGKQKPSAKSRLKYDDLWDKLTHGVQAGLSYSESVRAVMNRVDIDSGKASLVGPKLLREHAFANPGCQYEGGKSVEDLKSLAANRKDLALDWEEVKGKTRLEVLGMLWSEIGDGDVAAEFVDYIIKSGSSDLLSFLGLPVSRFDVRSVNRIVRDPLN